MRDDQPSRPYMQESREEPNTTPHHRLQWCGNYVHAEMYEDECAYAKHATEMRSREKK